MIWAGSCKSSAEGRVCVRVVGLVMGEEREEGVRWEVREVGRGEDTWTLTGS